MCSVGVSGHALHGGFGMSSHLHGLATDWIAGMTVVLANSTVVHLSKIENPDLFWAFRGAGSNFGIVTSFEFNTFAAPTNVTWFTAGLLWNKTTAIDGLQALEDYVRNVMPAELNMRVFATSSFTQLEGQYFGDVAGLREALAPLSNKTKVTIQQSQTTNWIGALEHYATGNLDVSYPYSMVSPLTKIGN
jgi:FAD/FMN-containing dehydrogenase